MIKLIILFSPLILLLLGSCRSNIIKGKLVDSKSQGVPVDIYLDQKSGRVAITFLNYLEKEPGSSTVEIYDYKENSYILNSRLGRTQHPRHLTFTDINGDKKNDIWIADHGKDYPPYPGGFPSLFISNGVTFDDKSSLVEASKPAFSFFSDAGDIDVDGNPELLLVNAKKTTPGVSPQLFKLQNGRFKVIKNALPELEHSYLTGIFLDYDLDGDLDLFLGGLEAFSGHSNSLDDLLLINDGKGTFKVQEKLPRKEPLWGTTFVTTVDLDLDGRPDIVSSIYPEGSKRGDVQVRLNTSSGWQEIQIPFYQKNIPFDFFVSSISVGDFSGSKLPDILIILRSGAGAKQNNFQKVRYYEQSSVGLFNEKTTSFKIPLEDFVSAHITKANGVPSILLWDYSLNYYSITP